MKKTLIIPLLLFTLLFSCNKKQERKELFSFDDFKMSKANSRNNTEGWNLLKGDYMFDSLEIYNGRPSLRLYPASLDTTDVINVYYLIKSDDFVGDSLVFSGKYKYVGADNTYFRIELNQLSRKRQQYTSSDHKSNLMGESEEWQDFSVKAALGDITDEIRLSFFSIRGYFNLWLNDLSFTIDGRSYAATVEVEKQEKNSYKAVQPGGFEKGSGLNLTRLTPDMMSNLEVLCKVWGFLKYYHPEVSDGNYEWDSELLKIMPKVAYAKDNKQLNSILNKWVDSYGEIKNTRNYLFSDSINYSRSVDLEWLGDKEIFDDDLIHKFNSIKYAERSKKLNYYVPASSEKQYDSIAWEDQGFRILNLFRIWNRIEYCYPYTHKLEKSWDSFLKEFILPFAEPKSQLDYELSIHKLCASLKDYNGKLGLNSVSRSTDPPSLTLEGNHLDEKLAHWYYPYSIHVMLTLTEDGRIVVKSSHNQYFKKGDILVSMDGKDVDTIVEDLAPYAFASNKQTLYKRTFRHVVKSSSPILSAVVIRDGKEMEVKCNLQSQKSEEQYKGRTTEYDNLKSKGIIYLDLSESHKGGLAALMKENSNARGMIIDMRKQSIGRYSHDLLSILPLKYEETVWKSENLMHIPGNFICVEKSRARSYAQKDTFRGKVAILVGESTEGTGEYYALMYRKAEKAVVIGTPTAGADTETETFNLVTEKRFSYSNKGLYYPNWQDFHRKGLDIDILAYPAIDDIKAGKDTAIDAAVKYILEK